MISVSHEYQRDKLINHGFLTDYFIIGLALKMYQDQG